MRNVSRRKPVIAGLFAAFALLPVAVPAAESSGGGFAHVFESIDGSPMPLDAFRGKALLVVNTASFCGFTRQYEGLQTLYERYEDKGLVVIGVPSNDFGGQEPKAEAEIKKFCQGAFGVTFPLTAKVHVTGPEAHPFYRWVAERLGSEGVPRWNFTKILIDRQGNPVAAYPSGVRPTSEELVQRIEQALAGHAAS